MKKIICLIICLLVPVSAFAVSDLEIMVESHNICCSICGAKEITGEPVINTEKGNATYNIQKNLDDIFFLKNNEVDGFACVCRDTSCEGEFLAQCVTACYNFAGTDAGKVCYDVILSQFMFARGGNPLGTTVEVPGMLLSITKESYGYLFIMVKVH